MSPHTAPVTPLRHKKTRNQLLNGTRKPKYKLATLKERIKSKLKLTFDVADWQAETISKILEGFDVMFIAGTGYGKSLIFEGLAAMEAGKVIIVISPLKALEMDQVEQAIEKGLTATMINEDNVREPGLLDKVASGTFRLVYISPEMALSNSFSRLWQRPTFRKKLTAVIVDECHCIDEYGGEFRPDYGHLARLRSLATYELPFVACSATIPSSTFEVVWQSLAFGQRPFWGVDVGCERQELLYLIRILENPKNPALDILNLIPKDIKNAKDIPKLLLYLPTQAACRLAVQTIRKCLPPELRDCVYPFSSDCSERAKARTWKGFRNGQIRILCATDAAGMGCNVVDVEHTIIIGTLSSASVLVQRWGRAARQRGMVGSCLWLVPKWAYLPLPVPNVAVGTLQKQRKAKGGGAAGNPNPLAKPKLEPKVYAQRREKMGKTLVGLVNLRSDGAKGCMHAYLRDHFRPETNLDTYHSFDHSAPFALGSRSSKSAFRSYWVVLPTQPPATTGRCCNYCAPSQMEPFQPVSLTDPRLSKFAGDFIFPLASVTLTDTAPESRPPSQASQHSATSNAETREVISDSQVLFKATPEAANELRGSLAHWRKEWHHRHYGPLTSPKMVLGDPLVEKLVKAADRFLGADQGVTPELVSSVIAWDLAKRNEVEAVAGVIDTWRRETAVLVSVTPRRAVKRKKQRRQSPTSASQSQPLDFTLTPSAPSQPQFIPGPSTPSRAMRKGSVMSFPTQPSQNDLFSPTRSSPRNPTQTAQRPIAVAQVVIPNSPQRALSAHAAPFRPGVAPASQPILPNSFYTTSSSSIRHPSMRPSLGSTARLPATAPYQQSPHAHQYGTPNPYYFNTPGPVPYTPYMIPYNPYAMYQSVPMAPPLPIQNMRHPPPSSNS